MRYFLCVPAVIQAQYLAVMDNNLSVFKVDAAPVESVSWNDAISFCNVLSEQMGFAPVYIIGETIGIDKLADGFRLPSEAEWQYACQAGGNAARYAALDDIAWYEGNADGKLHMVGQKMPNIWGLYDMLGNVWEWSGMFMMPKFMAVTAYLKVVDGLTASARAWRQTAAAATQPMRLMIWGFGWRGIYNSGFVLPLTDFQ